MSSLKSYVANIDFFNTPDSPLSPISEAEDKLNLDNIEKDNHIVEDDETNVENEIKKNIKGDEDKEESGLDDQSDDEEEDDESEDSDCSNEDISLLKKNSELFVVSVDHGPQFYVKTQELAAEKIWELARAIIFRMSLNYTCYIEIKADNKLDIIGSQKFLVVSYDRLHHTISYTKVHESI